MPSVEGYIHQLFYSTDAFTSDQTNYVGDLIFGALDNPDFVTDFLIAFRVKKENVLEYIDSITTAIFALRWGQTSNERRQFQHSVTWLAICLRLALEEELDDKSIQGAMKIDQRI